jgi:hypothetical protein
MNVARHKRALPAFTLIELILAILILTLVVGAVHGTLRMGLTAYNLGQSEMELYQSARVGLNRASDQLRSALSPLSFWRPSDQIVMDMTWEQMQSLFENGEMVEEEEPGAIQFLGTANDVTFARKVFGGSSDKYFDIQEVRLYADKDREELRLEVVRSLLDIKVASWYFAYRYKINLNGQIVLDRSGTPRRVRGVASPDEPYLEDFIGDVGVDGRFMAIASGIKAVEFGYYDGENWTTSWNSREIIEIPLRPLSRDRTDNYIPGLDFLRQERGLPVAVSVTFTLENGDKLGVRLDIPAGNLNHQGLRGEPRGETPTARPGVRMFRRFLRRRV